MPYIGSTGQMGYAAPASIPSLSLWYNASASSTVVAGVTKENFDVPVVNGTSLSKWKDLQAVAGDSNVFGGAANSPTYTIPIQNGLGAVTYNSANSNNLDINPTAWAQNLIGFTIYVVARPTAFPSTVFPLTVTDTSMGMWWNGINWSIGQSAGNFGTVTLANNSAKFNMYGMVFDGSQTGNAARLRFRYNKADPALTFTGTIGATTAGPAYFFFGGDDRNSGTFSKFYMNGYIGEVLIWTRTLGPSELSQVELYLNQKWNLGLT